MDELLRELLCIVREILKLHQLGFSVGGAGNPTAAAQGAVHSAQTFDEALAEYTAWRRHRVQPRTLQADHERSKALRKFFVGKPLASITAAEVGEFQQLRLKSVSPRTINMETGLLQRILKRAKLWERLAEDVVRFDETTEVGRAPDPVEIERLFKALESNPRWFYVHAAADIAISTSARIVELRHLQWRHVDWQEKTVYIRRSKTKAGLRRIPLNARALAAFRRLHQRAKSKSFASPEHLVFFGRAPGTNKPDPLRLMANAGWRSAWRAATRAAGLRGFRFHDLRHCVITELSEGGVPDAVIAELAGHRDRKMLERYTHVRLNRLREAVSKLAPRKPMKSAREASPGSSKVAQPVGKKLSK